MSSVLERVQVVAGAVVTFLVALSVAVTEVVNAVAPALPEGWQDNAFSVGGTAVAWLAAAVLIIRRVSPVAKSERGLLPQPTVEDASV